MIELIEVDADGMHQDKAQDEIAQMPQITRPDTLDQTAIRQLTKHRANAVAHVPQDAALINPPHAVE